MTLVEQLITAVGLTKHKQTRQFNIKLKQKYHLLKTLIIHKEIYMDIVLIYMHGHFSRKHGQENQKLKILQESNRTNLFTLLKPNLAK